MNWCAAKCPLDIVFVVDNSGSINDDVPVDEDNQIDNWALIRNFISSLVKRLNFNQDDIDSHQVCTIN
jgi:hypothetical protein